MNTQPHTFNLGRVITQETARRKRISAPVLTREEELVRMAITTPSEIVKDMEIFRECAETFLWIVNKEAEKKRFTMNNSQAVVLEAYYRMKAETGLIRMNILKGRQQGMSTFIGVCAIMEMLSRPGVRALIATEEKEGSGENLFMMYKTYVEEFQNLVSKIMGTDENNPDGAYLGDWGEGDATDRFRYGDSFHLANGSMLKVVGQKLLTSRTLQFVHLSEAAFYTNLQNCLGMMMQALPKSENAQSSMFIETTAKEYGNDHYDGWVAACAGRSAFKPMFLPWYIHEEYQHSFRSDDERADFIAGVGDSDDHPYGNEKELMELKTDNASWRKQWTGMDFHKYGYDNITYENLKFRRWTIDELNGVIPEFNRQYPTTPEMAFLSNTDHVLDMESIRWYMSNRLRDPEKGTMKRTGKESAQYNAIRGGVCAVWEGPLPYTEYVIGADLAEGMDIGDHSCAYVARRLPFRIVARLRGHEGRRIRLAEFLDMVELLGWWYNTAWICPENNFGAAMVDGLARAGYPRMISETQITNKPDKSGRFGWRNTNTVGGGGIRDQGVSLLQETIHNRLIDIPCEVLLEEAHHFVFVNGRPQAARKGQRKGMPGEFDDAIFAMIGLLFANKCLPTPKSQDKMQHDERAKNMSIQIRQKRRARLGDDDWMQWV